MPRGEHRLPRTVPLTAVLVAVAVACGPSAWKTKDAPKTSPDVQFRTGVEVGYDAWLWYCYEGERVLITQSGSACFGTSAPHVQRGPCGKPLAGETSLAPSERRHEIPEGSRWPNSTPESWRVEVDRDAASDAAATASDAAAPVDESTDACTPLEAHQIADRKCTKHSDCVLTDVPAECDACNLGRLYPTLASAVARRDAACALEAGASSCKARSCPPRDTYTPSFYRAECRDQRCIAYRYHGGG